MYAMLLQFALFQSFGDIKRTLKWLDPKRLNMERLEEKVFFWFQRNFFSFCSGPVLFEDFNRISIIFFQILGMLQTFLSLAFSRFLDFLQINDFRNMQ